MKTEEISDALKDIGLTETEVKVYLALNELGTSTVSPIVTKAEISNSKIYIILEKLIKKGLVSHMRINNINHYKNAEPSRIIDFIEDKKKKLEKGQHVIASIIPRLLTNQLPESGEREIEVFEGFEGLKTIRERGLKLMKKDDEMLILGVSKFSTSKYELYWRNYHKRRISQKISCKYLMYEETRKKEGRAREKWKFTKVRYMDNPPENPIRVEVYLTYTDIAIDAGKPFVISIKSKEVSDSFRSYFESLWNLAKK